MTIFGGGNDANALGFAIQQGAAGSTDLATYIDGQVRAYGSDFDRLTQRIRAWATGAYVVVLNLPNLASMPYSAGYTLRNWESMLSLQAPRTVLLNTFILTFTASTISAGLGTLISYVLIRTQFRGKRLLALAAWVPWGVPTIVLGLGMLWTALFTPASVLYGSVTILILAHVIRSMPLQTRLMSSTMVQIDKGLEEAARLHGATWGQTMWHVWLPLLKNGFVSGWIIAFAFSFSELALVAFLYGPKSSGLSTLFLKIGRAHV